MVIQPLGVMALIGGTIACLVVVGLVWRWNIMSNRFVWTLCGLLGIMTMTLTLWIVADVSRDMPGLGRVVLIAGLAATVMGFAYIWFIMMRLRRAMSLRLQRGLSLPSGIGEADVVAWTSRRHH